MVDIIVIKMQRHFTHKTYKLYAYSKIPFLAQLYSEIDDDSWTQFGIIIKLTTKIHSPKQFEVLFLKTCVSEAKLAYDKKNIYMIKDLAVDGYNRPPPSSSLG